MPKNNEIHSILIIGSGPIVIGQACEFDYAGTQACKALKEEGYRIILVNSNPATIMTDAGMADATYIEPITLDVLTQIIAKEKPDALLPTLGGQTALNCTLALAKAGILEQYGIQLIGASIKAIELAENRSLFQETMRNIGLDTPNAYKANSLSEAMQALELLHLPIIIRSSFSLGGMGASIVHTQAEYVAQCEKIFAVTPLQEVMLDEALIGWKEFELEVVRDKKDNCIIICGVENVDPLGVHTGDSITVAPIQTLTDKEYQVMRQAAFNVLRAIGVDTGGSNVQFAVDPKTGRMVVIEMNPRVSRSSALVSKASGFPIAKIAAKLAVGYTLDELKNDIVGGQLPAAFEPSLDYVVVKIPRFNMEKFNSQHQERGPAMYSVGEVMAIGRTFAESLQKAIRSLEIGQEGLGEIFSGLDADELNNELEKKGVFQLWAVAEAFRRDCSLQNIHDKTHIDPWFLHQIQGIIAMEFSLNKKNLPEFTPKAMLAYKRMGFSDKRLAALLKTTETNIAQWRKENAIQAVYKRVDSCAGEFITPTAYLYSCYDKTCEALPNNREKVMIIGSGPNRIGQGIEFDYCCVQAAEAVKQAGYETIMLNCNPETVSTDYDVVDRLYCAPLTAEDVLDIISLEKPIGVLVQYGGQTPLLLAQALAEQGVNLLGLEMTMLQQTEDRQLFRELLQTLALTQPDNCIIHDAKAGLTAANELGFPLIVRPSFVLGGASMAIVHDEEQLQTVLDNLFKRNQLHGVLIEQFLENAIEVDVDAICDGTAVFIPGLMEHIEAAGVHSGDSACITPPITLPVIIQNQMILQTKKIARQLGIKGLFNIQFAVQNNVIYVLEVNPRASRTLPFMCKATSLPLVKMATYCLLGKSLDEQGINLSVPTLPYFCVKEAVLPFAKFIHAAPTLGPEMKSTGEVMGIGFTPEEAYAKAQLAAGNSLPSIPGNAFLIATNSLKPALVLLAKQLYEAGFNLYSDAEGANFLQEQGVSQVSTTVLSQKNVDFSMVIALGVIGKPESYILEAARFAITYQICLATTVQAARAILRSMLANEQWSYKPMQIHYENLPYLKQKLHLFTGEELSAAQINQLIELAILLKKERLQGKKRCSLAGKQLAMIFDKPSLRTRFSFTVAMRELGGDVIESIDSSRKAETPEDYARVLAGYCHAIMVRTHDDSIFPKMTSVSPIPIINGLSDLHHPCQILADLLTLKEIFGELKGLRFSYIGDGNNMLHSFLLLVPQMGVDVHYCCPADRQPDAAILARSLARLTPENGKIQGFSMPVEAVKGTHAVYTDVWASMGFEAKRADHLFEGFQVNEALMSHAHPLSVFMHCLPMERGKEVSETLPESVCSVVFRQSENRLHIQKAILLNLLGEKT
ncbi:MAG: carbamoyl-phosphate synthase large subunit [Legionellales bacterium]|nr:carbamoyl-phosphate synthase large subunit [Legionellales bacterium]